MPKHYDDPPKKGTPPFVTDTLAPYYGNPRTLNIHDKALLIGATDKFPFIEQLAGSYNPLFDNINVDRQFEPEIKTRDVLVHEFAHRGAAKKGSIRVQRNVWRDIMTPWQRKEAIRWHGDRVYLDEDFAESNQKAFAFLEDASTDYKTAEAVGRYARNWTSDRRIGFLASKLLTREDSPFFNHPWKPEILEAIRWNAKHNNAAEGTVTERQRQNRQADADKRMKYWQRLWRMRTLVGG